MNPVIKSEYEICKRRGHTAGAEILSSNPEWYVCKWCKMPFRHETKRLEMYDDPSIEKTEGDVG